MDTERTKKEKRFWDRFARKYDFFVERFIPIYRELIRIILNDLRTDDMVLEVGTGTGIIAFEISQKVRKVHATDISPSMIHAALEKANKNPNRDKIEFSIQDAYSLRFDENMFDVCIVANALHIMQKPQEALKEAQRVLKPEGVLIAPTFCHGENIRSRIISRIMGLFGFEAYHKFTIEEFYHFIEKSGFEILKKQILRGNPPLVYLVAKPLPHSKD